MRTTLLLTVLAAALLPMAANAHGIEGEAAHKTVLEFIPVGIEHMLLGWDHLLFVAAVVLVAREVRLAAKLISLFVIGHSTTLITATLAGWQVNADAVDVVIALSVVAVAAVGILGRPQRFRWFATMVLGFGLIHGLGLATRFQALGIPETGQLPRVIAFNIGIEIGQLSAVAAFAAVLWCALRFIDPATYARAAQLTCAPIFVGGSIAAGLVALNAFTALPERAEVTLPEDSTCQITSPTRMGDGTGGHPDQEFFGADEATPLDDFGHSLGDGFVVVLYPKTTSPAHTAQLEEYVETSRNNGVLAGPSPGDTLTVMHLRNTMTCEQFELDSVQAFSEAWLDEVLG